jgi:ATP-dependent DNA ligase
LVFRDRHEWYLQSRDEKPLSRYFPELEQAVLELLPERSVFDGEIVIAGSHGLDFEALLLRIHPAGSRVATLARQSPAALVLWDQLALGDRDLRTLPLRERRAALEQCLGRGTPPILVTPSTRDRRVALDWFARFEGAGLDGVIAKPLDGVYEPGKRAMFKVKHARTADCVVAGFRWHKGGEGERVGSLLLGLYDGLAVLHHVGVAASFTMKRRAELLEELAPLRQATEADHPWRAFLFSEEVALGQRLPGTQSRWNRGKTLRWEPVRPEWVCEVAYDHMQGTRFRHTAQFLRWRFDKPPQTCTYEQVESTPPIELNEIFGS